MLTRKTFNYQGRQLSYQVNGEGPVVVLLHGFGEHGTIWHNQYDAFPGYQLIIPDLPGSGESEMIEDMSMEGLASAIKALLDHMDIEKVILIGHSMGGYITLAFVDQYADMLNGFGLYHSSALADNEEKIATRRKGIEFIKTNGALAFLKTSIPGLYAPATKEQKPVLVEQHIQSAGRFTDAALIRYYESMIKRPDRTSILKATALPVFFLFGRYDMAVPLADGLKQSHLPQQAYVHILEQSGHMGMIEEAETANAFLLKYISETSNTLSL